MIKLVDMNKICPIFFLNWAKFDKKGAREQKYVPRSTGMGLKTGLGGGRLLDEEDKKS